MYAIRKISFVMCVDFFVVFTRATPAIVVCLSVRQSVCHKSVFY